MDPEASAYRDDRERKKKQAPSMLQVADLSICNRQATASSDDDAVDDRKASCSWKSTSCYFRTCPYHPGQNDTRTPASEV